VYGCVHGTDGDSKRTEGRRMDDVLMWVVVALLLLLLLVLCCYWRRSVASSEEDVVHARRKRFMTESSAKAFDGQHPSGSYRILAVSTDVHGSLEKIIKTHVEQSAEDKYKEKIARRHRALSAMISSGAGGSAFFDPSNIPDMVVEEDTGNADEEKKLLSGPSSDDVETPRQEPVPTQNVPPENVVAPLPLALQKCPKDHALEPKGTPSKEPVSHEHGKMGERLGNAKAKMGERVTVSLMW
jgi:hypothetical protein